MEILAILVISCSILASAFLDTKPIACDLNDANGTCPDHHCCVRDTYLFSETYCKPFGEDGDACVTKPSFFECPCAPNHYCKSNLVGDHILSHFGKCHLLFEYTTEETATQMNITESTFEEVSKDKPDVQKVVG